MELEGIAVKDTPVVPSIEFLAHFDAGAYRTVAVLNRKGCCRIFRNGSVLTLLYIIPGLCVKCISSRIFGHNDSHRMQFRIVAYPICPIISFGYIIVICAGFREGDFPEVNLRLFFRRCHGCHSRHRVPVHACRIRIRLKIEREARIYRPVFLRLRICEALGKTDICRCCCERILNSQTVLFGVIFHICVQCILPVCPFGHCYGYLVLCCVVAYAVLTIIPFSNCVVIRSCLLVRDGTEIYIRCTRSCCSGNGSVFCAFRHRNSHFITCFLFARFAIITRPQCKRKFTR